MSVTEEEGGRLNAFAREPEIEVVTQGSSDTKRSWLILLIGGLVLAGLIIVTLSIT